MQEGGGECKEDSRERKKELEVSKEKKPRVFLRFSFVCPVPPELPARSSFASLFP